MDPTYEPAAMETRTLFGLQMEQLRNNAKIDAELFKNVVSKKKEVSCAYHTSIKRLVSHAQVSQTTAAEIRLVV